MQSIVLFRISLFITLSLILSNIALSKDKEFPFLRNGISFSIAGKWKVIANDSIGNDAYYFSAEREGSKSTGLITVTWVNKVEDPSKMIILHEKTMKSANIYRNPGIEFTGIIPGNFSGMKVKSCSYTTIVKDQKLDGIIYCFNSSQKTITIFFQTGYDDHKINQKAFDLLQMTFNCRD